ncbi:MAG: MMPL family transporter [Candidatus Rokubacteria bacterium]|nr:MMPL family transporter [Candidatus Rokubacteria bacterium]
MARRRALTPAMTATFGRLLRAVVAACARHPVATLVVALGLASAGIVITASKLAFETSQLHLLPSGQAYVTRYREYSQQFGELDELVIVVRGRSVDEAKAFAARLVERLRGGTTAFNHLAYRTDLNDLEGRALLYLPTRTLTHLRDQVFDHGDFLETFVAAPGLVGLVDALNHQLAVTFVSHFIGVELGTGTADDLGFLTTLVSGLRESVDGAATYRSPWTGVLTSGAADADAGYFFSDDKRLLFILADPVGGSGGFTNDRAAIDDIRRHIAELRRVFPGVQAGVTGGPALANDEMRTAFADSSVATGLAVGVTLALLLLAFRRIVHPAAMLTVLVVSLLWSMGVISVTVGHLTVFSVMFIPIVIGLGIDYGIYLLFRHDEEIGLGHATHAALAVAAARTGPGIVLGTATAAATFYALLLTDFHGVQELGFIAGTALVMACVAMLTVFPALLVLLERWRAGERRPSIGALAAEARPSRAVEAIARRPVGVLVTAAAVSLVALWAARGMTFDYNLLHLQAPDTESVVWEQEIIRTQARSSFSALATATSRAELERKRDALRRLPTVADVDSALAFLPDDQEQKLTTIRTFAPLVTALRVGETPPLDVRRLEAALELLARRLGIAITEAGERALPELRATHVAVRDLIGVFRAGDSRKLRDALTRYEGHLMRDFRDALQGLQRNVAPRPVTFEDAPAELRRKFVSRDGRLLLQIHPKVDVWDRAGAARFVTELRSIDPDVTGTPIVAYESIRRMENAYRQGTVYAFVAVSVIIALMLRRVRETALALIPLALGTLWTVGLMRAFDLQLNLANVWGAPLIIGAASEYGVNVVTRTMEASDHGGPPFARSTVMAVAFNGLTTLAGFGSLLVAHHRGIRSLGLLLVLGSAASLVAALGVLPVAARLWRHEA